jgi:uncharacterized protein DUF4242
MPRYIIERNASRMSREELDAVGRRSNEVLAEMPGVVWIRSYVSDVEGKIYCEYDAPNPEAAASMRVVPAFRSIASPK